VILIAVYVALVAVQLPWIESGCGMAVLYDEYFYDRMAVEIAGTEHTSMIGGASSRYPPLYSAILAGTARFFGDDRFGPGPFLNVLLLTTTLFGAYGIARRFSRRSGALLAGTAAVLGPSLVFPPVFLSENLFIPLFVFYVLAVVRLLEAPGFARAAWAGGVGAALVGTKLLAAAPLGVTVLFLLVQLPLPPLRRILVVTLHGCVLLVLTLPLLIHVLLPSAILTLEDAGSTPSPAIGRFLSAVGNHLLAPVYGTGPFFIALAAALAWFLLRQGKDAERRQVLLLLLVTVSTIAASAVWIAIARPMELRIEERYQLAVYPMILVLAAGGVEHVPPRWRLCFAAFALLLVSVPTFQTDPGRLAGWLYLNPSPIPVQLWAGALGIFAAKVLFVAVHVVLAFMFVVADRAPWRHVVWIGAMGIGLYTLWIVNVPVREARSTFVEARGKDLLKVERLLEGRIRDGDLVLFAGRIPGTVDFAFASKCKLPYWSLPDLNDQSWNPAAFDNKTGRFTWRTGARTRIWLVTHDGVTRGGVLKDREGPWRLFRLDDDAPGLHSFLYPARTPPEGIHQMIEIYLWPPPSDVERRIRVTPLEGTTPEVLFRRHAPFLETGWLPVEKVTEVPVPPLVGGTVDMMTLRIRGGRVKVEME